jgi:hypothetical protein
MNGPYHSGSRTLSHTVTQSEANAVVRMSNGTSQRHARATILDPRTMGLPSKPAFEVKF